MTMGRHEKVREPAAPILLAARSSATSCRSWDQSMRRDKLSIWSQNDPSLKFIGVSTQAFH
jgi:hypothetical protein